MIDNRFGELEFAKRLGKLVYISRSGDMVYASKTSAMVYANRTCELVFDSWFGVLVFTNRFGEARITSRLGEVRIASECWSPLVDGNYKVNSDAGFRQSNDSAIVGVLIHDHSTPMIRACTLCVTHFPFAFATEAYVAFHALDFTLDMGFQIIESEGDSLTVT
ncbi:hypothetical protein Gotur_012713 [Gossypium turneri]